MTDQTFFLRPSQKTLRAKTAGTAIKVAAAALGLMTLSACNHTDVATPSPSEPVVRNQVQMVRLAHAIKPEDDGTDTLSTVSYADLNAFLQGVQAGSADTVLVDAGGASADRVDEIANFIRKQGLTYGGQAVLGDTPKKGTIMLYVERYVVTPPDCGKWPKEVSNNQGNNTSAYLSCANIGNLGLMVANPRDLIAGQGDGTNATIPAVNAIKMSELPQQQGGTPLRSTTGSSKSGGTGGTGSGGGSSTGMNR
ncbi:CpaD family pilus assembly lipoprotein [Kordiimonas marina]|uniref:CpaD family pilus assembly lipoprotein n=1 Tax=Kordiimonas marina TaxID=2872312 RepID=UPI001FF656F5|nr:CpaD family pilus assembly lipoprotein [Kordiimonas marina]MCJ9428586.1 CpaD family pilus assembly protein [Kordiimonas marina]